MQIKNLADGVVLNLPDDLLWSDEHGWTPAAAAVSYLVTGALLVQSATRQAGRPITLVGAADMAWITRLTLQILYDWAALPLSADSGRYELTFADGRQSIVAFRHSDGALEAEPVLGIPAHADSDFYRVTLRLMTL